MYVPRTQLSLTVPKGWRRVDLGRAFADAVPDLMVAILGDELDAETQAALHAEFGRLRNDVRSEQIAIMALRTTDDGSRRDVLTVAVHGVEATGPGDSVEETTAGADQGRPRDRGELVSVAGREAIVHRSPGPPTDSAGLASGDAQVADAPGSWVQVVVLLSADEGAVVTIVSSAAGQEEELRTEGLAVAESLGLVTDPGMEV